MADRTVYGNTHSENGWRMVDTGSCVWVRVPGTSVSLQIREGQPAAILGAFAADYNAHIEPLRDADSACWTATNSVATSNHLSGTGMDLNWNGPDGRTFRLGIPKDRAYPGDKARKLDELLAFYEKMVFCGGNWSIRDWMHFQMGGNTYGSQHVEKVNDFIRRKIRADGFSTFKRDDAPPPAPKPPVLVNPAVNVLARAAGINENKAREILPGVINGLRESDCTNPNRIAMWLAQMGHESGGFVYTEEIASGAAYEGRRDLGNTHPGDGVRFKGRSWIQITGRHNFTQLSKWAFEQGAVPTPTFFVDEPTKLSQIQYAGLGPAWYWTVARPDINALSDRRDLVTVTQRINGGQNGIQDRRNRYDRALALGNELLTLTSTAPNTPGDDMAQVPQEQWDRVYRELTQKLPSRSPLRHLGEGVVDTLAGFTLNVDGSQHVEIVRLLAGYGHPETLALLREVAGADPNQYPDRQKDAQLAQAILAEATKPTTAPEVSVARTEPVYQFTAPEPVAPEPLAYSETKSVGQKLGAAYDALAALQLDEALPPAAKAPLDALLGVLQNRSAS